MVGLRELCLEVLLLNRRSRIFGLRHRHIEIVTCSGSDVALLTCRLQLRL